MTTVGFLYPGHFAEDDYPRMEILLDSTIRLVVRHTENPDAAYREDALRELGAPGLPPPVSRSSSAPGSSPSSGRATAAASCTARRAPMTRSWPWRGRRACRLSSTSIGFVHAVRKLGANRVAVAATYPEDIAAHFTSFLRATGMEVVATHAAGVAGAAEAAAWGFDQVKELARAADRPEADAVLLPDTALHTVGHLAELEEFLGKPVLTANQVAVREALRLADRPAWAPRLGALFAARESPCGPGGVGERTGVRTRQAGVAESGRPE